LNPGKRSAARTQDVVIVPQTGNFDKYGGMSHVWENEDN